MDRIQAFTAERPLLFSIAYRMLGSVMDAEDMVQETYLRWERAPAGEVQSPKSYLSTIITRLCIDQLRSAKAQREQYIGPWLPEPLVTEETAPVDDHLALADSLSMAFLVLLERLSPVERAVFLLREVFDYPYPEIARMVDKSEANCRQLAHRAREQVSAGGHRFDATPEQLEEITQRFLAAAVGGDLKGLLDLLTEDVTLWSDGGGKTAAALNPIYGADRVARFFIGITAKTPPHYSVRIMRVNGEPGLVIHDGKRPYAVITAGFAGAKIAALRVVVNPDKLRRVPVLPADA